MKLSDDQKKYEEAIRWLIGGPYRSGRTFLLAKVMVDRAIDGHSVYLFDHNPMKDSLIRCIHDIAKEMEVEIEISWSNSMLRIKRQLI